MDTNKGPRHGKKHVYKRSWERMGWYVCALTSANMDPCREISWERAQCRSFGGQSATAFDTHVRTIASKALLGLMLVVDVVRCDCIRANLWDILTSCSTTYVIIQALVVDVCVVGCRCQSCRVNRCGRLRSSSFPLPSIQVTLLSPAVCLSRLILVTTVTVVAVVV